MPPAQRRRAGRDRGAAADGLGRPDGGLHPSDRGGQPGGPLVRKEPRPPPLASRSRFTPHGPRTNCSRFAIAVHDYNPGAGPGLGFHGARALALRRHDSTLRSSSWMSSRSAAICLEAWRGGRQARRRGVPRRCGCVQGPLASAASIAVVVVWGFGLNGREGRDPNPSSASCPRSDTVLPRPLRPCTLSTRGGSS